METATIPTVLRNLRLRPHARLADTPTADLFGPHVRVADTPTADLFGPHARVVDTPTADLFGPHVRVTPGQVVDQHAAPFEAQFTHVALVDEAVVVRGRHLAMSKRSGMSAVGGGRTGQENLKKSMVSISE